MTNQAPSTTEIIFFRAQTTNASSTPQSFIFPMKRACLKYWGTWDGATVTFQTATPLDSTYFIPVDTLNGNIAAFTSDGQTTLEQVVYGDFLRCTISGGGLSMNLNVTAQVV